MNTVQQIIKIYRKNNPNSHFINQVEKVFSHIELCSTEKMGYHLYRCSTEGCNHTKMQYHSCHDRHCPRCGNQRADEWIENRSTDLLPCIYYHLVFTVPHQLNTVFLGNMSVCYNILFKSVSETLLDFANNKKYLAALPGIISVLHTWGQNLSFHPHLHCIITGGGMKSDGLWKQLPFRNDGFLFPVKALKKMYRGKLLDFIDKAIKKQEIILPANLNWKKVKTLLYNIEWNIYSKSVMTTPVQVIEYLGNYTHKVAISNRRIIEVNTKSVRFYWRDYRDNRIKKMSLIIDEFVSRLALHILPKGFVKIRQYGLWAYRNKDNRIAQILKKMNLPPPPSKVEVPFYLRLLEKTGIDIHFCPRCKKRSMVLYEVVYKCRNPDIFKVKSNE